MYIYIHVGPPVAVNNIKINPIDNTSIVISWLYQNQIHQPCIMNYTVIIINSTNTYYTAINNNMTFDSLIIGINYSFTIIPIDNIGREGPPSSLLQYKWNGED